MLFKGAYDAAIETAKPFTDEGIWTEAALDVLNGLRRGEGVDRKTGARIWREEDPTGDKIYEGSGPFKVLIKTSDAARKKKVKLLGCGPTARRAAPNFSEPPPPPADRN